MPSKNHDLLVSLHAESMHMNESIAELKDRFDCFEKKFDEKFDKLLVIETRFNDHTEQFNKHLEDHKEAGRKQLTIAGIASTLLSIIINILARLFGWLR